VSTKYAPTMVSDHSTARGTCRLGLSATLAGYRALVIMKFARPPPVGFGPSMITRPGHVTVAAGFTATRSGTNMRAVGLAR
jgi:hypothetical protein